MHTSHEKEGYEYDYLSDDDDNELSELDIIKELEDMG